MEVTVRMDESLAREILGAIRLHEGRLYSRAAGVIQPALNEAERYKRERKARDVKV